MVDAQQWLFGRFGLRLNDAALLAQALSHRSVGKRNNERLEFLGDSVLGFVVSDEVYRRFPDADEGQLSRLRVSLVNGKALAEVARELQVGEMLILGSGELHGGGRRRDSILADTFEALLGAVFIDLGFEACRSSVLHIFAKRLDSLHLEQARKDPKTRLQEFLQARGEALPDYAVIETSGEEHNRTFIVMCSAFVASAGGEKQSRGTGGSRRAAEQAAASEILRELDQYD